MRKLSDYLVLALKGMAMGAADVVPGVSGGTIAFITGIYKEFVGSINAVNLDALKLLLKGKFKEFWTAINGNFLLAVALGIAASVFSLATVMKFLLGAFPVQTWAVFFGLVSASVVLIAKDVKDWSVLNVLQVALGIAAGVVICTVSPAQTPDSLWFVFICGMIAICAMVLPGISGSFILVLLGKYEMIIGAVSDLDLVVLGTFAAGALIGIVSFCKFLTFVLNKAYKATVLVMLGFIIGSLVKIWPWSAANTVVENIYAGVFCLAGIALVAAIELIAHRLSSKS